MPPTVLAPAAAFTPPNYLATAGDASPQAELDRASTGTGTSRVSLRADAFASSTAPVPRLSDANIAVARAKGLAGNDMGSWLSRAAGSTGILRNIPIIGPILTGGNSAPTPAPAAVQPTQITVTQPAANDNTKTLMYVGLGLGAAALLATLIRRK